MTLTRNLSAFAIAAGIAGLACVPSQAATMRFTPAGSQLDGDSILDILLKPGETITFSNYFNNSSDIFGPFPIIGSIPRATRSIDYVITYDPTELSYVSSVLDVPNKISNSCLVGGPCGSTITPGLGTLTIRHRSAITNLVAPQGEFLLDTITFVGTGVNPFPGDGLSDYSFTGTNSGLTSILFPNAVISTFNSNTVEVQQPVPAPLPILGAAAAFGSIRRAKKLSSLLKPIPKA